MVARRPPAYAEGMINERGFVTLGGLPQWISIRGDAREQPILVLVHGGPGSPYSLFTPRLRAWERHFTVVQWDQRGAGRTFSRSGEGGSGALSFDRLADDGLELVEHLCARLGQARVILLASSAGSITGTRMVTRRPERFGAYVGTDQHADVARAERFGWAVALERLREAGKQRAVDELEAIGGDPTFWDERAFALKQRWTIRTDRHARAIGPLMVGALARSPLRARAFFAGMRFSQTRLYDEYISCRIATRFDVPVVVLQGDSDVLTPTGLAAVWLAALEAPHRDLALLPDTGHLAALLDPQRFLDELVARVLPLVAGDQPRKKPPMSATATPMLTKTA
jgi:pimeloyl-ACP methyl ester carboxylesterase